MLRSYIIALYVYKHVYDFGLVPEGCSSFSKFPSTEVTSFGLVISAGLPLSSCMGYLFTVFRLISYLSWKRYSSDAS